LGMTFTRLAKKGAVPADNNFITLAS
jgi:hypothetical protein